MMYEQYRRSNPAQMYVHYPCIGGQCMYYPHPFYQYGQMYPYYANGYNYETYPNAYVEQMPVQHESVDGKNVTNQAQLLNDESANAAFTHQFLNEHGQVDVNKMLSTVGQLAETVQQVSPVIKQVNDIIQSFRA